MTQALTETPTDLRTLWELPLEEQQRLRHYGPWGPARNWDASAESAGADLPKIGRFYLLGQTCGTTVVVDPRLPWNEPSVGLFSSQRDADDFARERTRKEIVDEVTRRFAGRPNTKATRAELVKAIDEALKREGVGS